MGSGAFGWLYPGEYSPAGTAPEVEPPVHHHAIAPIASRRRRRRAGRCAWLLPLLLPLLFPGRMG